MQQTWVRNLYQTRIGFKIFLLLWSDWRFSNEDTYTVDNTIECEKEQNRSKNIYLCFLSIIYALCIHLTIKLACFWLVAWMAVLVWEGEKEGIYLEENEVQLFTHQVVETTNSPFFYISIIGVGLANTA